MRILHVTHNDADALGCALVVRMAFHDDDVTTKFCSIGEQDDYIDSELSFARSSRNHFNFIIISDLSVSNETLDIIDEYCKFIKENLNYDVELIGADHHLSNKITRDWFKVTPDMPDIELGRPRLISATEILFYMLRERIYFNSTEILIEDFKLLCESISRYDVWEWRKEDTRKLYHESKMKMIDKLGLYHFMADDDYYAILCKKFSIESVFDSFTSYIDEVVSVKLAILKAKENNSDDSMEFSLNELGRPLQYIPNYNIIYESEKMAENAQIERTSKNVRFVLNGDVIEGYIISQSEYDNAIIESFYSEYNFVERWVILYPSSKTISFRTNRDDVNVARYATRVYGGGGHAKASGARLSTEDFMHVLDFYYNKAKSIKELLDMMDENECDDITGFIPSANIFK